MARKKKHIHYLYKTTCNITNRYYIGMHSTNNVDDGYMGSGRRLRYSIRKYGKENHTKEILEYFDSRELLIEAEKEIITGDMIGDKDCMNLRGGGEGGGTKESAIAMHKLMWNEQNKDKYIKLRSKNTKKMWDDPITRKKLSSNLGWVGKNHTEETKQKISVSKKGKGTGENNSQYGTCWITNGKEVKKIKKEDLEEYLVDGWKRGRKIK